MRATIFCWSWWRRLWLSALTRCRSSMKTARSMSSRFKKGLALVSPAWMRAVRRRKLCERRCIRSGESKRLSPSRGLSTAYGHEFTNCSEKMYSKSQLRKAERLNLKSNSLGGQGVVPDAKPSLVQTSFNLMGVGRFAWRLEILDCRGQNQSGTGGYNQTEKRIEVGE